MAAVLRVSLVKLLKARAAVLAGEPLMQIARRLKISDNTVMRSMICDQLPTERCPTCGGKVIKPCHLCMLRSTSKAK